MNFRDSPDSLNGLGIPGNNWFRRFTITYIYIIHDYMYICTYFFLEFIYFFSLQYWIFVTWLLFVKTMVMYHLFEMCWLITVKLIYWFCNDQFDHVIFVIYFKFHEGYIRFIVNISYFYTGRNMFSSLWKYWVYDY